MSKAQDVLVQCRLCGAVQRYRGLAAVALLPLFLALVRIWSKGMSDRVCPA